MPQPMQMPKPTFKSLEEAWIDLTDHLSREYLELLGEDIRKFFFAGANAAFFLMLAGNITDLRRDLDRQLKMLKEELDQ